MLKKFLSSFFKTDKPKGLFPEPGSTSPRIDDLISEYYELQNNLTIQINRLIPNIKSLQDTPHSFFSFISNRITKCKEISILDIGSENCFLSYQISRIIHHESRIDCVDISTPQEKYNSPNINFQQMDIFEYLQKKKTKHYDYIFLGAILALFSREQRNDLLLQLAENADYLFIREVPRLTNLIDVYCQKDISKYKHWWNFTETELKQEITAHGFTILDIEHEYDIYIFAQSKKADWHDNTLNTHK